MKCEKMIVVVARGGDMIMLVIYEPPKLPRRRGKGEGIVCLVQRTPNNEVKKAGCSMASLFVSSHWKIVLFAFS